MPQKILIISRQDDRVDFDTADSMIAKLRAVSDSVDYQACFLEQVMFTHDGKQLIATNGRTGEDLSSYDGIFLIGWFKLRRHEDVALAISLYAADKGVKVLNSEALVNRSRSKLSQQVMAVLHGVSTGPFVIGVDKDLLIQAIDNTQNMTYPMVVKSATASRGGDNYLIHNREELVAAMAQAPTKIFVAQAFIPNDGDYRLLVMNGAVQLAIRRKTQSDSHLNNTSQGGSAHIEPVDGLSKAMLNDALTMSRVLRRELTGIDMIVNSATGSHHFLEANNMPQLSTGSFVEEKAIMLDTGFKVWLAQSTTDKPA